VNDPAPSGIDPSALKVEQARLARFFQSINMAAHYRLCGLWLGRSLEGMIPLGRPSRMSVTSVAFPM
jgi:hypothetical protein